MLRSPGSTLTRTLFPYPTLFRSPDAPVELVLRHAWRRVRAIAGRAESRIQGEPESSRDNERQRQEQPSELSGSGTGGHVCSPMLFRPRSEEHTSELQSLMRISYAVLRFKKKNNNLTIQRAM